MRAKLSTLTKRESLAKARAALKNPSKEVIKKYKRFMRISSKEHKRKGRPWPVVGMVQPKNGHRTTERPEKKFSPRTPTQSAPSVVTRHQLQFGGGDPDAGIFPAFFSPPIRRRKQRRQRQNSVGGVGPSARKLKMPLGHLASGKNVKSARGKMQGIGGEMLKQSTSKRLFKNPHMPTQSTPSVTTRRRQMQQQNGKIAQQSFKSISRNGRRRRTTNCPPRFSPSPRRRGGRNRGLGVVKMEIDEFGEEEEEEEEEKEEEEEEEEEDPVSEIDLLCGSNSPNPEPSNGGDKIGDGQSEELSQKDHKMMARCAFAQVEVAIDNGQLDRTVRQILRTRSEEMVPDARPSSSILFQPSPCFSLASCRPDFERISAQIGVELREECESLVFLCLESPVPGLAGSLLCFSESVDADAICVDEFRQLELAATFEWLKAGKQQFLDAVFGRCIQFFGIGLGGDFKG